jgi:hypothetical protein
MLAGIRTGGKKVLIPFFKRCSGCIVLEVTVSKKDLETFLSLRTGSSPG